MEERRLPSITTTGGMPLPYLPAYTGVTARFHAHAPVDETRMEPEENPNGTAPSRFWTYRRTPPIYGGRPRGTLGRIPFQRGFLSTPKPVYPQIFASYAQGGDLGRAYRNFHSPKCGSTYGGSVITNPLPTTHCSPERTSGRCERSDQRERSRRAGTWNNACSCDLSFDCGTEEHVPPLTCAP